MLTNNLPVTEGILVLKAITLEPEYGGTNIAVSSRYGTLTYPLSTIQAMLPSLGKDCSGVEAHPLAVSLYLTTFKIQGIPIGGEYSKGESFWSILPSEEQSPMPMNESLYLTCFLEFLQIDGCSIHRNTEHKRLIDKWLEYHHKYYYPTSFTLRPE